MHYLTLRNFFRFFFIAVAILTVDSSFSQNIEGYVFVDKNHNSVMDSDERGLKNVMVSNQENVVITDEEGFFQIKLIEGNYIFVTKPAFYQFNLDEFFNPEFYFLYKTKRIKGNLNYSSAKINTEIPEVLYFPVYQNTGEEAYTCLLVGDPQMQNKEELNFYKEGIIPFMAARNADFYIELGDIANNNLEILSMERQASATLGIPGYRVFGNHDMNYHASDNRYASETFKAVFGPDYYSFDYGKYHYVILNNVVYEGWQKESYTIGKYSGGLDIGQKKWLVNDLKLVPVNKTIVLLSHIPLHENFLPKKDMKVLFKALKYHKKIFAISGHLHGIIAYDYKAVNGWEGDGLFEGLVAGAVCGSWWSGFLDSNNIPIATCTDGSPKGFFQLNVKDESYDYLFCATTFTKDLQMRTYVDANEILVNWFVGKRTDSVWVQIDEDPQMLNLQNFVGRDPFVELNYNSRKKINTPLFEATETAHLWKVKLPKELKPGDHTFRIVAKDSKGRYFEEFKTFNLTKK